MKLQKRIEGYLLGMKVKKLTERQAKLFTAYMAIPPTKDNMPCSITTMYEYLLDANVQHLHKTSTRWLDWIFEEL